MRYLLILLLLLAGFASVGDARIFGRRGYYYYSGSGWYAAKSHCRKCKKPFCPRKHCHKDHCKHNHHHCHQHNEPSQAGWDWRKRDNVVNNFDPRTGERRKIRQGSAFSANPEPVAIAKDS